MNLDIFYYDQNFFIGTLRILKSENQIISQFAENKKAKRKLFPFYGLLSLKLV